MKCRWVTEPDGEISRREAVSSQPYSIVIRQFTSTLLGAEATRYPLLCVFPSRPGDKGLEADRRALFSLLLPRRIWEETKRLQNDRYAKFADRVLPKY